MAALTPSLEDSAATISSLGELAGSIQCNVSCGGTIPEVKSVDIIYKKEDGDWSPKPLQLPADVADQDFLGSCSSASFGRGRETVSDKTYRDALKLEPERFRASFEIANSFILEAICKIMCVSSPIRAELYMLNVYSIGGHFKSHVDTPRSKDMFGSLVVCLPSEFTGGALVTRHQGREVAFDWSSSTSTHWAAFFSDVEHEVLPVTSGHRITLTYNLYYSTLMRDKKSVSWSDVINSMSGLAVDKEKLLTDLEIFGEPHMFLRITEQHQVLICRGCGIDGFKDQIIDALKSAKSLDVTTNPLYLQLLSALQNSHFLGEGGTLGFFCQHKYTDLSTDLEEFSRFLKGSDAVLYKIAKSLNLEIALKPILTHGDDEDGKTTPMIDYHCEDEDTIYILPEFESYKVDRNGYGEHVCNDVLIRDDYIKKKYPDVEKTKCISWCQQPEWSQLILSTLEYGNCPSIELFYQAAAFLIEVPEFTDQRGSGCTA